MKTMITNQLKTKIRLLLVAAGLALCVNQASAQTTIAKWTFENLTISAGSSMTNFSNGRSITNIVPEFGSGTASASHPGSPQFGGGTWSTAAGNGSAKSLTSSGWTNNPAATSGDYYQFAVNTTGFTNIAITFDSVGSASGPKDFIVKYSTDGITFTQFGSAYAVLSSPSWSSGAAQTGETYTYDLSSITSLANASIVYLRLVVNSSTAINNSPIGTAGTSRIDNFLVTGTIAGLPQVLTQPANTTNFFGDSTGLTVVAGGNAPLVYQWYTNSTPLTPLTDGPSGYGAGTITGSTNATLALTFVNTNQTGNYRIVITNNLGTITSAVVHLQVNIRTPIVTNIAFVRKLHDINFAVNDTTNIYVLTGIVTTPINLVSGNTEVESFFMQDTNTGVGCDVFFRGGFYFPAQGDIVRVTAPALQFNGLTEMAPVNSNPAHNIELLSFGNVLPAPLLFDISSLPTPTNMEEVIEGQYMIVSNVFIGVATNVSGHYTAGGTVFMTNQLGKIFNALVPNNPAIDLVGTGASTPFAKSVRGVMSQSQTTGTVLTNGYNVLIARAADIEAGSPVKANPDAYTVSQDTTTTFLPLTNDVVFSPVATPRILSVTAVTTTNGVATIVNGTNITFTPDLGYVGTLTMTYTATDDAGFSNMGTIAVTVTAVVPSTPIPLNFQQITGNQWVLSWTNAAFNLQSSTNVAGPYSNVDGASSPYTNSLSAPAMFFRLKF
jgi:hypothetical protein